MSTHEAKMVRSDSIVMTAIMTLLIMVVMMW